MTIEWVRVDERLPEKSGYYFTYGSSLGVDPMFYSAKHKLFNVHDHSDDITTAITVTHWHESPIAPEEVQ